MYTAQKNNKKLKALYDQSLHIKSAIPHPLILGMYLQFKVDLAIYFKFFIPSLIKKNKKKGKLYLGLFTHIHK